MEEKLSEGEQKTQRDRNRPTPPITDRNDVKGYPVNPDKRTAREEKSVVDPDKRRAGVPTTRDPDNRRQS